jgi:hypothetical protein
VLTAAAASFLTRDQGEPSRFRDALAPDHGFAYGRTCRSWDRSGREASNVNRPNVDQGAHLVLMGRTMIDNPEAPVCRRCLYADGAANPP